MSKYILLGEPICDFTRKAGNGIWMVMTQDHANKLQRQIGVVASRKKFKLECKSMPVIIDDKIRYILIAHIYDPKKLVNIEPSYMMGPVCGGEMKG